jgi:ATP synthase protein I
MAGTLRSAISGSTGSTGFEIDPREPSPYNSPLLNQGFENDGVPVASRFGLTASTMDATRTARRVLALQMLITLAVAALAWAMWDLRAAGSALLGGMINLIATGYFAYRVFALRPGSTAHQIATAFYIGETVKIVLTGALFTVILVWLDVAVLPLFLAYIATMLAFWLALVVAF